jgi:hypothetical protein
MDPLAIGFWGAFFGSAALALAAAVLAFARSASRVAFTGALAALLAAAYALVFLEWLPIPGGSLLLRLQALTAIACATVLAVLLLLLLGIFRRPESFARARWAIGGAAVLSGVLVWFASPAEAVVVGMAVASAIGVAAIVASAFSAWRGERTGWFALAALVCVCIGMWALDWYVLYPDRTPWQLHALSAVAGIGYLLAIGTAMWTRYAYLIEVREVMTQGPEYDPVTRMPAWEAGRPMLDLLTAADVRPCGLIAVCISNLKALEELHGRAAYNHGLFVCASRLRRLSLPAVEMVRLREDGFLLMFRHFRDIERLIDVARAVERRLARPVRLGTSREMQRIEEEGALWEAALGIGVIVEQTAVSLEIAIAGARSMARTAWTFPSGMAWYDDPSGSVAELPMKR